MSAIIKTLTPFIDLDSLCKALEHIGCKYTVVNDVITTHRPNQINNSTEFRKDSFGKYSYFEYSRQDKQQLEFIRSLENHYNIYYKIKIEELEREEKIRIEKERLDFIEKQTNIIIERATEQGYSIKKEKINGKTKLILVKNTY